MTTPGHRNQAPAWTWSEWALRCAIGVVAILLVLDLAYFVHGSLETFPAEEKQSGIREITGLAAVALGGVEAGLCLLLRRVRQASA